MPITKSKIYINGSLVGFHNNPVKLKEDLLNKRRKGEVDDQINIAYNQGTNEVYISTDSGRVQRPLIILENGKSKLTKEMLQEVKDQKLSWSDLVKEGVLEYLDSEEEENALVALDETEITLKHTHLEISGTAIFSVISSMIPFINHNMAGKAIHGAKVFKQGVGIPAVNYRNRFDTEMHVLYYPQKTLVTTRTEQIIEADKRPMSQNAVVAIMPFKGFNMTDAIIINKGAIERGMARSSYYRTYSAQQNRYPSGQADEFIVPTEDIVGFRGDEAYMNLGEDGICNIESFIEEGGVVIGISSPPRFVEEISEYGVVSEERREASVTSRRHLRGYVDKVMLSQTVGGIKLCKVKVRSELIPQVGDKFCSNHGQKGVIGAVINEQDMPFTSNGMKPDFLLNPHSIPSRMTVGHLLETVGGKVSSLTGEIIDGTPFNINKDNLLETLKYMVLEKMVRKHFMMELLVKK
jgi:DNA-directed RNA polymerase subunit B'